jgi:death-on-curing protein
MEPQFLSITDVLELHTDSIERYGGDAAVRDIGLLESALAQPQAGFGGEYAHDSIPAMAAAYAFHIVKNHPFVDGNKRTGAMAAFAFLRLNGFQISATNDQFQDMILGIAEGRLSKAAATVFFEEFAKEE